MALVSFFRNFKLLSYIMYNFFYDGIFVKYNIFKIICCISNLYHLFVNYNIFNLNVINCNCFALAICIKIVEDMLMFTRRFCLASLCKIVYERDATSL